MSTLNFEFETKDLYQLTSEEPTSRLLEIEFDVQFRGGDFECEIENIWCCDSHKFIGDAPYKLSDLDMKAIKDRMQELARDNFHIVIEDQGDSIKEFFDPIFGE